MPDFKNKIRSTLDGVETEVITLVGDTIKRRRREYEDAAKRFYSEMKADLERFGVMLLEGQISRDEFELLSMNRAELVKVQVLEQTAVAKARFEALSMQIAKIGIKAVFALLL
ncbi:MAG: hypothetical protein ACK4NS_11665 [Saprospiraceae bacterium]